MTQASNINQPNTSITNNTHLTVNMKTLQLKLLKSNDSFPDNVTSPEQHNNLLHQSLKINHPDHL